jgi:hypothetical protein
MPNLEDIDAREHRSKAKWHASRVGKDRNASLAKVGHHTYQAELLERGVKDSQGEHLPMAPRPQKPDQSKQQPVHYTKLLNVGHDDPNVKTGFAFR